MDCVFCQDFVVSLNANGAPFAMMTNRDAILSEAALRRFRAKVRRSFCTLKSFLCSGKPYAIATSLFATSFHLSNISSDQERAGLGA
jgi:hypothetical protein